MADKGLSREDVRKIVEQAAKNLMDTYGLSREQAQEITRKEVNLAIKGLYAAVDKKDAFVQKKLEEIEGASSAKLTEILSETTIKSAASKLVAKAFESPEITEKIKKDVEGAAKRATEGAIERLTRETKRIAETATNYAVDLCTSKIDAALRGTGINRRVAFWAGIVGAAAACVAGGLAIWTSYNTKEAARLNAETNASNVAEVYSEFKRYKTENDAKIAILGEDFKKAKDSLEKRLADKEAAEARLEAKFAAVERNNNSYEGRVKALEDSGKSFAKEQGEYLKYAQSIEAKADAAKKEIDGLRELNKRNVTKEEWDRAYTDLKVKVDKLVEDFAEYGRRMQKYEGEVEKRDEKYNQLSKELRDEIAGVRRAMLELEFVGKKKYEKENPEEKKPGE